MLLLLIMIIIFETPIYVYFPVTTTRFLPSTSIPSTSFVCLVVHDTDVFREFDVSKRVPFKGEVFGVSHSTLLWEPRPPSPSEETLRKSCTLHQNTIVKT